MGLAGQQGLAHAASETRAEPGLLEGRLPFRDQEGIRRRRPQFPEACRKKTRGASPSGFRWCQDLCSEHSADSWDQYHFGRVMGFQSARFAKLSMQSVTPIIETAGPEVSFDLSTCKYSSWIDTS